MIKNISKLLTQIENADVVKIDGFTINSIHIDEVRNDDENEILNLLWTDEEQDYSVKITEEGLKNAVIDQNMIECEDHEGTNVIIAVYDLQPTVIIDIE